MSKDRSNLMEPSRGPTALHRRMLRRKYGMFIHFGINTFNDLEWSEGTLPATSYCPPVVDTDDWARAAKEAGMKYVILVTKHHDGFCMWSTGSTGYGVDASPNATDVVAAMAASCQKHGLELGLYYSLWDRHWGDGVMRPDSREGTCGLTAEEKEAYVTYMEAHLNELMGGYGEVCELWLDGGWVMDSADWQIPRIYECVKRRQPNCAVGVNWTIGHPDGPEHRRVLPEEQEEGYPFRYFPSDFRLGDPHLPADPDPKLFSHRGETYYLPFETTVCLNKYWFFNTTDEELKSVEELADLYRRATAQDNVLILNSPPNRDGVMPEGNVQRLRELAGRLAL